MVALAGACLLGAAAVAQKPQDDIEEAKRTVERIYRDLPRGDAASVPYSPELRQWIARDAAYARAIGAKGTIDRVPLCGCRRFARNFSVVRLAGASRGQTGAKVWVTVRNDGLRSFAIDLAYMNGGWRVKDVHGSRIPSFLALMRYAVPRQEARLRRGQMRR
jgi:hypothetical protein